MPRTARRKSETDIYHIMFRGTNGQAIFIDDEDNKRFLDTLNRYQQEIGYVLYAYCLMGNHIHLLIKEGNEDLSNTMRRIGTSYVNWYNWQYDRKGHLFQDRFKSEPVESDSYFLTVLRYIHQNPLKAGLVSDIESYKWSSYHEYIGEVKIVKVDFALLMFAKDRVESIKRFINFNLAANKDQCLDIAAKKKTISNKKIKQLVVKKFNLDLAILHDADKVTQLKVLKYLKDLEGTSLRQLSRLTGISVNRVFRA